MTDDAAAANEFHRIREDQLLQGWAISWSKVAFIDPDGDEFERDVIRHPGAVAIVAVDDDGRATLVRQYRAARGELVLEIPAGTCDVPGEPRELTALRELGEEAGLEADVLTHLVDVYNAPGYSDQATSIYLATGLRSVPKAPSGVEERWMSIELVHLDDIDALVADGTLHDATTLVALHLARRALREND